MHQSSVFFLSIPFKGTQFHGNTLSFLSLFMVVEITKTKKFTVKRNKNAVNENPRSVGKTDSSFRYIFSGYGKEKNRSVVFGLVPKRCLDPNRRCARPGRSAKRRYSTLRRSLVRTRYDGRRRLRRYFFQRSPTVLCPTSRVLLIVLFDEPPRVGTRVCVRRTVYVPSRWP